MSPVRNLRAAESADACVAQNAGSVTATSRSIPRVQPSGLAFLVAQLLDVTVFNWLRRQSWWRAPLFASLLGSGIDTAIFFSLAFAGTAVPWDRLATSDLAVKLLYAVFALIPYRVYMALVRPVWAEPPAARA